MNWRSTLGLTAVFVVISFAALSSAFSFTDMFPVLSHKELQITILNPQSYPVINGNWSVSFNTTGSADLTITAVDGTVFGGDLGFLEVRCGNKALDYRWVNNSVFVPNYSCSETGYEISKVLTSGKHTLRFRFGSDTGYAYNLVPENITFVPPTPLNNSYTDDSWVYINITSDEVLNQSLLEWGNSTGYHNISMTNSSTTKWYVNMTSLTNYIYNYTVWAQNTTGTWVQTGRRFVTVDTTKPTTNATPVISNGSSYEFNTWTTSTYVNVTLNCSDGSGSGCDVTQYCLDQSNSCIPYWLSGLWSYRQEINIPNTAGNQTNYQVKIELNSSNVGSNWNWSNDGNDTRFTYYNSTSGTETEISYWIESWNSTSNKSTIWVKVPFLENNTNTIIYMYYGNPSAASASNGTNTFMFFDDFPGTSLDTSKWDTSGGASVADSKLELSGDPEWVKSKQNFTSGSYSVDAKITSHNAYVRFRIGFFNDRYKFDDGGSTWWAFEVDGSKVDTWGYDVPANGLVGVTSLIVNEKTRLETPTNGHEISQYSTNLSGVYLHIWQCTLNIDWVRVRKYASSEPGATVGSEESPLSPLIIQISTEGTSYIRFRSNDTAGNPEDTKNETIKIDTTEPSINFTDPTTETGNHPQTWISANVTASDSGVGLDTINLTLYNSTGDLIQSNTSQTSSLFVNFTGLSEGTYYLNATANDTFGHTNSTETRTILLDTTNPALNFTSQTEENGTTINRNWTEANITIDETNLNTFKFNWNTTNYTFYDDSLVLAMNFNNNSGVGEYYNNSAGMFIRDISGYGNNGTTNSSPQSPTYNAAGKFAGAFEFDGVEDKIVVGDSNSLDVQKITLAAWIYMNQLPSVNGVDYGVVVKNYTYFIVVESDTDCIDFGIFQSGQSELAPIGCALTAGEWHYLTATFDGDIMRVYQDGIFVDSLDTLKTGIDITSDNLEIGFDAFASNRYFNGSIDEVRIYSRALNSSEIWMHYQTEFQKYNSTEWRFYSNITNLTDGTYTYYGWANDSAGNNNQSEIRALTVDTILPALNFTPPTPDNAETINENYTYINVSVADASQTSAFIDWNRSLVGYWNFEYVLGNGTVYDNSTWRNHGTMINFTSNTTVTGRYGKALLFDGVDDYVKVPNSSSLKQGLPVSFSFWMKPEDVDSYPTIIATDDDNESRYYGVWARIRDSEKTVILNYGDGGFVSSTNRRSKMGTTVLSNSIWYHITVVVRGATDMDIYINGVNDGGTYNGTGGPIQYSDYPSTIGLRHNGYFNGTLDEVRVWNRALSPEEINASFNNGAWRLYRNFTDLADGTYEYYAGAIDSAGNFNVSETRNLTVDPTADLTLPVLDFTLPTPDNNSYIPANRTQVNLTITEPNLDTFKFNWNGTEYTYRWYNDTTGESRIYDLYDPSLVLAVTFNNMSAVGESYSASSTDETVYDYSGSGNNVTTKNSITYNASGGRFGGAFEFDGVDDMLTNTAPNNLNLSVEITVVAWIYPKDHSDPFGGLISYDNGTTESYSFSYMPATNSTQFQKDWNLVNPQGCTANSNTVPRNQWTFVAFTYNSLEVLNNAKHYINGHLDKNCTWSGSITLSGNAVFNIGVNSGGGDEHFNGTIDELRIYGRALSADEIWMHYQSEFQRYNSTEWRFYSNITNLTDGTYTYYGWANDSAGNTNQSEIRTLTVDTILPALNFTPPTPDNAETINVNYIYINVSVNDASDTSAFIDWNRSLVGYWNFEYVLSNGTVYDNSSWGNDGAMINFTSNTTVTGKFGRALLFDGDNDYVNCGNDTSLDTLDTTWSAWFKLSSLSGDKYQTIIAKDTAICDCYDLDIMWDSNDSRIEVRYQSPATGTDWVNQDTSKLNITTGEWHHVTAVMVYGDAGELSLYIDGEFHGANADADDGVTTNAPLIIGGGGGFTNGNPTNNSFNGTIDEVRIWNRALSPEEINASFNNGAWRLHRNFTDLADGTYEYYAGAIDLAGNFNVSETRTLTVNSTADITPPALNFTSPTPDNNSYISTNYTQVNLSITEPNLDVFKFNWDGTDYVFYNDSLVLAMNFNNNSGVGEYYNNSDGMFIRDISGYGNNGTTNSTPQSPTYNAAGRFGGAFEFDGAGDYISIPNSSTLKPQLPVSFSFWIKPEDVDSYQCIISTDDTGPNYLGVWARIEDSGETVIVSYGDGGPVGSVNRRSKSGTTVLSNSVWYHVAVVVKGATDMDIYINGVDDGGTYHGTGGPIQYSGNPSTIGFCDNGGFFNGTIDEVRIYGRSLSADEILVQYQSELQRYNSTEWRFYTNITNLTDGTYSYYGWANDSAGNSNQSGIRTLTVDTILPVLNFTPPTEDNAETINVNYTYINVSVNDASQTSSFIDWNRSLVGYWNFEYVLSNGTVYDNSTYQNPGLMHNFTANTTVSGKYGKALLFDGVDDYVQIADDSRLDIANSNCTVEGWVYSYQLTGDTQVAFQKYGSNTNNIYGLGVGSLGQGFFFLRDTGGNGEIASYSVDLTGAWHHLVGVREGDYTRIYVDGILRNTTDISTLGLINTSNHDARIGMNAHYDNDDQFNGIIDEVRVWNRALSPGEINASYNNGAWRLYRNFTDLADGTYEYYGGAIDLAGNFNVSETRTLTIGTSSSNITIVLNKPENDSYTNKNCVLLNATVTDADNDTMTAFIYADNNSNGLNASEGLVYIAENVASGATLTYNLTALPIKPTEEGLVLLMHFDNTSEFGENDSFVYDFSGSNNDGTCSGTGCPTFNLTGGRFAGAFEFDDLGDRYFSTNSNIEEIANGTLSFTIETWVLSRDCGASDWDNIVGRDNSFTLAARNNQFSFGDTDLAGGFTMATTACIQDEWAHLVGVYNGTDLLIYVNGNFRNSTPLNEFNNSVSNVNIGAEAGASPFTFNGTIDEVAIYNRSLSADEIAAHYSLGDGKYFWKVNCTDSGGLSNVSDVWQFTVDTIAPAINFTPPTPPNNTTQSENYAYINVSVTDSSQTSSFIDWNRSLVGYWNFEYVLSNGTVYDNSTYQNHGLMHNFTANTTVTGKYGGALLFDGVDDYVSIPNRSEFKGGPNVVKTIEAWFKTKTNDSIQTIVGKVGDSFRKDYWIGFDSGNLDKIGFWSETSGEDYRLTGENVSLNEWHHVAVVIDRPNTDLKIYLDGLLSTEDTSFGDHCANTTANVEIGGISSYNNTYFNGIIDEVRVWNRALSPGEINASYNNGAWRLYRNFTGLTDGIYEYYAGAIDLAGNFNVSETRTLNVSSPPHYISNCSVLDQAGATYYLTADITNSTATACMNITAENVILDCQGHRIDGNLSLNVSSGDNKYAVYSNQYNATIRNCRITNWQTGIYFDTGADNGNVINNTLWDLYGFKGTDAGDASNNPGGIAAGIYLKSNYNKVFNNTISNLTAGAGGFSSGIYDSGGAGGIAAGIYLETSANNSLTSNNITNLTGGKGGNTSGSHASGGPGGTSAGIYLSGSEDNNLTSNTILNLAGGPGGDEEGAYGSAGTGGISAGIRLETSEDNTLTSNTISNLAGGAGGDDGGTHGSAGTDGTGAAIWLATDSYDNTITPTTTQGAYSIPDDTKLNTLEGVAILYFHGKTHLNISDFNVTTNTIPILIGGSIHTGNPGGLGGKSTGLALINVNESIIQNNTVSGFGAMPGGAGDVLDPGGFGGSSTGIHLESSNNNNLTSNQVSSLVGGMGGTGGMNDNGGSGGISSGIHLLNSINNNLTLNVISNLAGGTGGVGGNGGSGGSGGMSVGIHLETSEDNNFASNTILSNLAGGTGGSGGLAGSQGVGGTSAGIWLDTGSYDNTLTPLSGNSPDNSKLSTIGGEPILYFHNQSGLNVSYFNVAVSTIPVLIGGSAQEGGAGGISTGLALINVTNSTIHNNTISGFGGMPGGPGRAYSGSGGAGGTSAGIYLGTSKDNNLTNNTISGLTGGMGGTGGIYCPGGAGGTSTGIYLETSEDNNLTDSQISGLIGGAGGSGGFYGSGGTGGTSTGVYLSTSQDNNMINNVISGLTEGAGGTTTGWGGSGGAAGASAGIWVNIDSYDNTLTPLSGNSPDNSKLNTIEGEPILYFHNQSGLNVSDFGVAASTIPVLIGGSIQSGDSGGTSTGLALINITASTIHNNTISGFGGMPGGSGGVYGGAGGAGGISAGIYLETSKDNNLTNNTISSLAGGEGGTGGGYRGSGGSGGTSTGIYLSTSEDNNLTGNIISGLAAGAGGLGGWGRWQDLHGGSGGTGGTSTGIYLETSEDNNLTVNQISGLAGGAGGPGGNGGSQGTNGTSAGIWLGSGSYGNEITRLSGNSPDQSNLNRMEGKPILYFHNQSGLNISGFNVTVDVIPILIGGSTASGGSFGSGGTGGISTGLALIDVINSTVHGNVISGFCGMPGGTGGREASGGIGGASTGIYLSTSEDNNLTSNTVSNLTGGVGGAQGYSSSDGVNGTSYFLYLKQSNSTTVTGNVLGEVDCGFYLYSTSDCLIYNNLVNASNPADFAGIIYNNSWNTTRQAGARIYSPGNEVGGNYWTNSSGGGYSDTCVDSNHDGFCDLHHNLTGDGMNIDYLPLSDEYSLNNIPHTPQLNSPGNDTYINRNYTLLNWTCTDPDGDTMTAYVYGDNSTATTLINTTTCLNGSTCTFNWTGLNETTYYWMINCTDSGSLSNVSDVWQFTVDWTPSNITLLNPLNNTNLSAGTTWTWINISTDENAVCRYNLSNSSFDFTTQGVDFTNTGGLLHSFNYSGLSDGQTYTLHYKCNDSAGNINPGSVMHVFGVNTSTNPPTITDFYNNVTGDNSTTVAINETQVIYFNVTVDQQVDYSWYRNGTPVGLNQNNWTWATNNTDSGIYNLTVIVNNSNGTDSVQWDLTINDLVPDNPPSVQLNNPADNLNTSISSITFNCTAWDDLNLTNVTLYHSCGQPWGSNGTNTTPLNNTPVLFMRNLTECLNARWNCYACDTSTQCSFAPQNRTFSIDLTPPTSNQPADASYNQGASASIGWIPADNYAPGYYRVLRNGTTQNTSTLWFNGSNLNIQVNTSTVGVWNYTLYFNDSVGHIGTPDTVFINITTGIDNPPTVQLNSPQNGVIISSAIMVFNCTASDDLNLSNVTLYGSWGGWHANETNSSGVNGDYLFTKNLTDGVYTWSCYACDSISQCSFAGNNTFTANVTGTPDLYISPPDIGFSDPTPTTGQVVTITANIHNLGGGSSSNFTVEFLLDGVSQDNETLSVGPYSTDTTSFLWTAAEGAHIVSIAVDPINNITELNESNNNASRQITVSSPPPPPPSSEDMFLYTDGNCVNQSVTITVRDEDSDPVSGVDVRVYFSGSRIEDLSTNSQGETSFIPQDTGGYELRARRSGYRDVDEDLNIISCGSCSDGIINQDETDVDCGGSCPPCGGGGNCSVDEDCISGWCYNGTCRTSTCSDGIRGPGEQGVDCGGPCPPCASCNDSVLNQDETDIDCGGSCPPCGDGGNCSVDEDCISGWCYNGTCRTPTCYDGILNQDETDVDCGGNCSACEDGGGCVVDEDCVSGYCYNGTCMTPTCFDGIQNLNETGIDCGGPCIPCHCFSGVVDGDETGVDCGGACPPCQCSDGACGGNESDVDCGGECPPCDDGRSCLEDSDCISGWCYEGTCRTSTCSDGIEGPGESGVDCGGPCLPCHCFDGITNFGEEGVDCGRECPPCVTVRVVINETETGEVVVLLYNVTSICLNNRLDGGESDVDCGGHCPPCEVNRSCLNDSDCLSGWCYMETCRVSSCMDGICGPGEEKIDCGGPCGDCPWIKVGEDVYLGENLTITLINPRTGLILKVTDPRGGSVMYNITHTGLSSYRLLHYNPKLVGSYKLELVDYDEVRVDVLSKPMMFFFEDFDEVVAGARSLLIPLIILVSFLYWFFFVRRTRVVADAAGIRKLIDEDLLEGLREVYTIPNVAQEFKAFSNLKAVELSDAELDEAEDLSGKFEVSLDEASIMVLCGKLRAKTLLTSLDLIEKIGTEFRKTKLKS